MTNTYTDTDAGCYVDGARGIYAVDRIVEIANEHGADIQHTCCEAADHQAGDGSYSEFAACCEFADEYEDDADTFMNDHYPVEDHYWGRNESGDWGLWRAS